MSLDRFLSTINTYGVAKTNKYVVDLPPVSTTEPNNIIQYYAASVTIPGYGFSAESFRVQSPMMYMPSGYEQDPIVRIEFLVDTTHMVRQYIDDWMSEVMNKITGQINYATDYMRDFEVTVLDSVVSNKKDFEKKPSFKDQLKDKFKQRPPLEPVTKEYEIAKYRFVNCWPKSVASVTLANDSPDHMKVAVEIHYEKMFVTYVGQSLEYELRFPQQKAPKGLLGKAMGAAQGFVQDKALGVADTAGGIVSGFKNFRLK